MGRPSALAAMVPPGGSPRRAPLRAGAAPRGPPARGCQSIVGHVHGYPRMRPHRETVAEIGTQPGRHPRSTSRAGSRGAPSRSPRSWPGKPHDRRAGSAGGCGPRHESASRRTGSPPPLKTPTEIAVGADQRSDAHGLAWHHDRQEPHPLRFGTGMSGPPNEGTARRESALGGSVLPLAGLSIALRRFS